MVFCCANPAPATKPAPTAIAAAAIHRRADRFVTSSPPWSLPAHRCRERLKELLEQYRNRNREAKRRRVRHIIAGERFGHCLEQAWKHQEKPGKQPENPLQARILPPCPVLRSRRKRPQSRCRFERYERDVPHRSVLGYFHEKTHALGIK